MECPRWEFASAIPKQLRAGAWDPPDVQRMRHKPSDMATVQLTPQHTVTVPCLEVPMCLHCGYKKARVSFHVLPAPCAMDQTWSIPEVKVTF